MGERHLVYIRINDKSPLSKEGEELYYNGNVIGLHVQWLLGYDAFNCLVNILDFHKKNLNFSPFQLMASDFMNRQSPARKFTNAEKVLQALYTVCPITGFWENSASILDKDNFFYNDNNTGITVVDFLDFNEPRYCFINPNTLFVDSNVGSLTPCHPLDAQMYLSAFGQPPEIWEDGHLECLLEKISKVKVLSKEQLFDIFLPNNGLSYDKKITQIQDFLGIEYKS
ncbi:MAG: hypothetical protein GQ569_04905 [Methylococcaceae bacterium]|nr:hypothetical protein [Methylococcaceae bacterium]